MADPLKWLREQVAEDRTAALACAGAPWIDDVPGMVHVDPTAIRENKWALSRLGFVASADNSPTGDAYRAHIVRHDPRAVLAQCEAHTAILDAHTPMQLNSRGDLACPTCVDWDGVLDFESPGYGYWPCRTVLGVALAYQHRPGYAEAVATLEPSTEGTPQ